MRGLPVKRLLPLIAAFVAAATMAVAALGASLNDASPLSARPAPLSPHSDSSIVVGARSPADFGAIAAHAGQHGYVVSASSSTLSALRIEATSAIGIARAVGTMLQAPGAVYAEPLYRAAATDVPADPLYNSRQRAYLEAIGAPAAWDIETGRAETIVAVIDTGVDGAHPDLQGRMWVNADEIVGNGVDDDGNGCIDDVNGCAFVSFPISGCAAREHGSTSDDSGHGTFVSGIIAANANNGQGIAGIARGVSIMAVKVLDCDGGGNSFQVAQGILYAAENGAKVLNVSLGGPSDPLVVREAVRTAFEQYGALVVAATGNTGEAGVSYPARYSQALAVGAASLEDPGERAEFSTWGPEVDVVAIGEDIVGTVPAVACGRLLPCISGGPYAVGSGTSFSAPQVTGLAALIVSRRPTISPQEIIDLIKSTAVPVPSGGKPNWAGAGMVDMAEALKPQFRLGAPGTARN